MDVTQAFTTSRLVEKIMMLRTLFFLSRALSEYVTSISLSHLNQVHTTRKSLSGRHLLQRGVPHLHLELFSDRAMPLHQYQVERRRKLLVFFQSTAFIGSVEHRSQLARPCISPWRTTFFLTLRTVEETFGVVDPSKTRHLLNHISRGSSCCIADFFVEGVSLRP